MRAHLPAGALKHPADDVDISDLTASQRTGPSRWDEGDVLVIPFDTEPTPAEQAAILRRLTTDGEVEESLHARVMAAYDQLAAFESQTSPTGAQTVAVVKLLCKVVRGLIRLQLRRLDETD